MKYKNLVSAGGIIYKKTGKLIKILLIKDPKNKWTFPKGIIENNEAIIKTAKREIKEEVNLTKIKFLSNLGTVHYKYSYRDTLINKTVHYLLFELIGKELPKPQKEEGISQTNFFTLKKAFEIIGYRKTNAPILKKTQEFFGFSNIQKN